MEGSAGVGFPFGKNAVPAIPAALSFVFNVAVEGFALQGWWMKIPFLWIAGFALIFWAGMIFADVWNANSQLRRWWRFRRRCFDMTALGSNSTIEDKIETVEFFCVLKFRKNLSNPLLTVRITQLLSANRTRTHVVHQERLGEIVKDQDKRVRLGFKSISKPGAARAKHSIWGSEAPTEVLKPGQVSIVGGNKEIIEIAVDKTVERIFAQPIKEQLSQSQVILNTENDRLWLTHN